MRVIWEKEVPAERIKVSPRPVWKCRVCEMYGKRPSCPPHTPDWREASEWIRAFKKALLVKFEIDIDEFENEKREVILWLLKREAELFREGKLYVLALFPGSCNLCPDCPFEHGEACRFPTKVRPSVDAIGIELNSLIDINFSESALYALILVD